MDDELEVVRNDDFPIFAFFRKEWTVSVTVEEVLREARRVDSANIIQRVKVYNFRLTVDSSGTSRPSWSREGRTYIFEKIISHIARYIKAYPIPPKRVTSPCSLVLNGFEQEARLRVLTQFFFPHIDVWGFCF